MYSFREIDLENMSIPAKTLRHQIPPLTLTKLSMRLVYEQSLVS